jgi:hypothetical protein
VTLREVIAQLADFASDETIYADSATPTARALVAVEPEDGSVPAVAAGLQYLLEFAAARGTIEVWQRWRPGETPTLDGNVAAVTYYAANDAWLPIDEKRLAFIDDQP